MPVDHAAILDTWFRAMLARDLDGVMRTCHPDIRLGLHFGNLPLPFIGVTTGREACRRRTRQIFDTWTFPSAEMTIVAIDGDEARLILRLTIEHRWTGYSIDMSIRQNMRFEDGLIRSCDGYMDAPRFEAFMRFVGIAPQDSSARIGD